MMSGKGFRCPNCNKSLAVKLVSPSEVAFHCPRCKAYIYIRMREPVPWAWANQRFKDQKVKEPIVKEQTALV